METIPRILFIDFCNFEDYPIGGHLSFAKNLIWSFNNQLALVGVTTTKEDPIGKWFKKDIDGITFDFFALKRFDTSRTKHLIPDRLVSYFLLKFYKKKILSSNIPNVFMQRTEILLSTKQFGLKNICYCFAGVGNPLVISKYWYAKYLATLFDKLFFSSFENVNTILASSDEEAINNMLTRSKNKIKKENVSQFPTRIRTEIFKPMDKSEARNKLGIPKSSIVISTTGRLAWFKGWMFMIDCFAEFEKTNADSLFYLVGEGEDYDKILAYIVSKKLQSKVKLVGKRDLSEVADFLNASDLYIMGSFKEGWSTTLIEALACGVPICTTDFSSAKEIVTEGLTGYVIENHNMSSFIQKMEQGLKLNTAHLPISSQVEKYAVSNLKDDLLKYWKLN